MKVVLTSSLIVGLAVALFSTIEKKGNLIDQSKVTYNITEDKKLNGAYLIEDADNVTRLRGSYVDNKRTGDWYCFDKAGKLVLRYNYTANKLLSLDKDAMTTLEIKVVDKDVDVATNARIPVPICSVEQYKKLLIEELKDAIPAKDRAEKLSVTADITAMVDQNGSAKYVALYLLKGVEYKANLYTKDKLFSLEWLPAKYNDKTYKSEVKFSSTFELDPGDMSRRFIWNY
ncbi:toxin-antitoxin system YwqK family antitoxin [Pedobacter insulae]|uniref:Uncharacterized protein n=1 Tax=Pedobacter insulae TaxID=414048 RepID=A0A1I2SZF7_9SPHI|nr:hypothetical protein [Pedobacter insulae]SFG57950.1 hypothetical protein SAMN04489864_101128 [Pedobacter insulae]